MWPKLSPDSKVAVKDSVPYNELGLFGASCQSQFKLHEISMSIDCSGDELEAGCEVVLPLGYRRLWNLCPAPSDLLSQSFARTDSGFMVPLRKSINHNLMFH